MSLFKKHLAETMWRLENEPELWVIDQYTAAHKSAQIRIWHTNRYYAVDFTVGSARYGGGSFFSSFFGWASPWRRRLCRAVDVASDKQRESSPGFTRAEVSA